MPGSSHFQAVPLEHKALSPGISQATSSIWFNSIQTEHIAQERGSSRHLSLEVPRPLVHGKEVNGARGRNNQVTSGDAS